MRATSFGDRIGDGGGFFALREKKLTAEYAETAELFLGKEKDTNHFMDRDSSLPSEPPGLKIRG
jgi:hypothetical protein